MPKNNPGRSAVSAVMGRWPFTSSLILLGETSICLQLVAGRDAQAGEFRGGVDLKQLAPRDALEIAEAAAAKQGLGIGAGERAHHAAL